MLSKHFCPNTSSLGTIYDCSKSKVLKMVTIKNKRDFTNKKPAATSTLCKQIFSMMHHIDFIHTLFSVPSLPLYLTHNKHMQPGFKTVALALTQNLDKINMVHLRKISLAESRGSSRFFNNKVVSDFDFGHFLKKSI